MENSRSWGGDYFPILSLETCIYKKKNEINEHLSQASDKIRIIVCVSLGFF